MPYLPDLSEGAQTRAVVDTFGGYNHNLKIAEGEWYDAKNLSSEHFPMFSQRRRRGLYAEGVDGIQGVLAKDALAWVDGSRLFYNGRPVEGVTLSDKAENNPKQMVSMGAYLCIFPDNVYVNTVDLTDCGSMEAVYTSVDGAVITFTPCRANGEEYAEELIPSDTEPEDPVNGQYWLDTSSDTHVLKQYSSSSGMWVQIPTVYTKIACEGIGKLFAKYDGVTISGIEYTGDYLELKAQVEALNTSAIIQGRGDDYIIVVGLLDQQYVQQTGNITVARTVPSARPTTDCGAASTA